jgi:5-dehydro-2-deoxygluconokinase
MNMDVWVLGRIGYDLYAIEHGRPLPEVEHFSRHLGGSSANMAVGLARLGLKVGIISAVGDDLLADYLLEFLKSERVDMRFVSRLSGSNTSLCLTEVCPPERFRQVFYRSNPADAHIEINEAALAEVGSAKMFITNGTSLTALPSRNSALVALQVAKQKGTTTVFDVDYRPSSWPDAKTAGEHAKQALAFVDVVLANEEELALLTSNSSDPVKVALSCGPRLLVQKLGARGVAAHSKTESHVAPSRTEKLLCAIGGGDAFASGFLYGLLQGFDLPTALAYGNASAAIVVGRVSCSDAMPRLEEIEALLKGSIAARA